MLPFLLLLSLLLVSPLALTEARTLIDAGGPVRFAVVMKTWKDQRDRGVVKQGFDYSCGAAALATLLQHHHSIDASEQDVLQRLGKEYAASFADLKRVAESYGLRAVGLAAEFPALQKLKVPAIVYVDIEGRGHFAVVRGVDAEGRVWLADPSQGNRLYSKHQFLAIWNTVEGTEGGDKAKGKLLAVLSGKEVTSLVSGYFIKEDLQTNMRP